jgi:hypothetical protein
MASNWIKVEVITPDKPEIYLISEKLNIDPDMVLGKLIRLWVWTDQQIAISNANSVTDTEQMERKSNASVLSKVAIDRITFMPGFADALIYAGWIIQEGESLFFVNFEKHNGKSSKNRALTNDRVNKNREKQRRSNEKGNEGRNAAIVTPADQKALPEEEEEKELKDKKHISDSGKHPNQTPPSEDKKYPAEFEILWREYPKRSGSNSKSGAFKNWKVRRKEGISDVTMLEAVRRYHTFCIAEKTVGTKFVKLAQTFLGPDHEFDNPWEVNPGGGGYAQNIPGNGESIAERQLREGREQYLREQQQHGGYSGMAPVGPHDQNLQQPLDCEEWQSTIGNLGAADWGNDQ